MTSPLANGIPTLQRSFTEWVVFADVSDEARRIAEHSYDKHVVERGEFPEILSQDELAAEVDRIINSKEKSVKSKILSRNRKAYWDKESETLVIQDPSNPLGGTIFRPDNGKRYYDTLE